MNIGLAIDKKNGVESKVIATGKSGAKETHQNSLNLVNNPFGGEYEIKEAQNEWNGWGTALKPSFEPIIVARKPLDGTCVDNVIKWGVGGINIDECRVETNDKVKMNIRNTASSSDGWNRPWMEDKEKDRLRQEIAIEKANNLGRFPANTILTYDDTDYDEVCGGFPQSKSKGAFPKKINGKSNITFRSDEERESRIELNDSGSASRYFYNAKTSKRDRDEGLEELYKLEEYHLKENTPEQIRKELEKLYEIRT